MPAALLTIANCQLESGNKTAARKTFNEIINDYPDSEATKQAQQVLKNAK